MQEPSAATVRPARVPPPCGPLPGGRPPRAAQDAQYWNIQYGPVGQLLGGQVVGSTRDLLATYYNPGGLGSPRTRTSCCRCRLQRGDPEHEASRRGQFPTVSRDQLRALPRLRRLALPESWLGDETRLAFSLLTRQQFNVRIDERAAHRSARTTPTGSRRSSTSGCPRPGAGSR